MRFILGLCFLSSVAAADPLCIKNMTDYQAQQSQLPSVFQTLPVMFTADNLLVTAGMKIRQAGARLKLEGSVWKPTDIYSDDAFIAKVCFTKMSLTVTLDNGKVYNATVNKSGLVISDVNFGLSSDAKFAGIVQRVQKEMNSRNAKTAVAKSIE